MVRKKDKPKKLSVFTPDDAVDERGVWLDGFSTDIETVKKEYPSCPIYEYQLVAVHTPPAIPTEYTRKEIK